MLKNKDINPMWISQAIIWKFLEEKKCFTKKDLYNEIRKRGGAFRIEPAYTIDEYIEFLENIGALRRNLVGEYFPNSY